MNDVQRALVEKAVMLLGEYRATKDAEANVWERTAEEEKDETLRLMAENNKREARILTAVMNTLGDALAYPDAEVKE